MLLSPERCYSSTSSKEHFYEKVPNAVVHPTLPTPFKGEGEQRQGQRQQQQQLQKYTGKGSAGLQLGLWLQQQRWQANRLHPPQQLALLHSLPFHDGAGEEGDCRPIILPGFVNRPVSKQQRHLVKGVMITVRGYKLEGNHGKWIKLIKKKIIK